MSNVSSRHLETTRYEFFAPQPVDRKDMELMKYLAERQFASILGRDPENDDDIWVTADDDNIIVYFEVSR